MPFSYKKLWKLLIDKDVKKTDLINKADISSNILAKMGKNEPVSLLIDCNIGDVIEINKVA